MQATKAYLIEDKDLQPRYATADEFYQDLLAIRDSLLENKGEYLISGEFVELMQAVEIFGFYLASIDMRQTLVFMKPVAELQASAGINDHYSDLSEDENVPPLKELEDPRISATHAEKSELLEKELSTSKLLASWRINWGKMSFAKPSSLTRQVYLIC